MFKQWLCKKLQVTSQGFEDKNIATTANNPQIEECF